MCEPKNVKKILAYRFSALGDVAMTVPVIREFLEQNRGVRLVMLSSDAFADLFRGIPGLLFRGVDLDQYKGMPGLFRLYKELRKEFNPDVVADLHRVIRSDVLNVLFKVSGCQVFKLNKNRREKKKITNPKNPNKYPLRRVHELYADVFRDMGFELHLSHQLRPFSHKSTAIGFAPFSKHGGKTLPLDKSFNLCKAIAQSHKLYLFGGGDDYETEILESWECQIPNTENLAGKLSLKEELDKIAELELMISMDSSNMHLASIVGTRVISIWGATHHYAGFLGYGQNEKDIVETKNLSCRPCSVYGNKECFRSDWKCLEEISIDQVLSKITFPSLRTS